MTTFSVATEERRLYVLNHIETRELPFTVQVEKGLKRSTRQERTHRMWMKELEAQGDQTAEEYRGFCKLWFGVRLMKYQSEAWAEAYDKIVKPLDYQQKLMFMMEPISYPLTSLMDTKTFTRYLDDVFLYFTGKTADPDRPMDEQELLHHQMIGKLRLEREPRAFVLTIPDPAEAA